MKSLPSQRFQEVLLLLEKPRKVWVTTFKASVSRLEGERIFAIVMNASSYEEATDIDYFITNVQSSQVTSYGDSKDLLSEKLGRSFLQRSLHDGWG